MKALISGQAGIAVLIDGSRVRSVDIDSPDPIERSGEDIPYLFGEASDVTELSSTNLESTLAALELSWRQDRALHLVLILLNRNGDREARQMSAECLEEFLPDRAVHEFVCNRLYSAPLPPSADLVGSLLISERAKARNLEGFLERLVMLQGDIREHRAEWDALDNEAFGGERAKLKFTDVVADRGVFRGLVETPHGQGNAVLVAALSDPQLRLLPRHREVLTSWIQPSKADKPVLIAEQEDPDVGEGRHRASRGRTSKTPQKQRSHRVFENVNKQKDAIKKAISERHSERASKYIDELVEYQLQRSESKDLAKSLCDLAMFAKGLGANALQLELAMRAVQVLPTDGWSQAQLGDAYHCCGRYEEAYVAYTVAENCGVREVAASGRAEVLKSLGRLEEALEACEATVADFPQDVVARNGGAEVLKSLGRLEEALEAYEATVADFPQDVVARTGRAEVLKSLGRPEEALEAYEAAVADFPQNVVARAGRAEVLKSLGRLEEALEACEATVADFPQDVVARNGRAEVLKSLGRLEEALIVYDDNLSKSPTNSYARIGRASVLVLMARYEEALRQLPGSQPKTLSDWVGYHLRGMIALRKNETAVATKIFEECATRNPWRENRRFSRRALAVTKLRSSTFEDALAALADDHAIAAEILRVHAFGGLGETEKARETLIRIPDVEAPSVKVLRAEFTSRYVDLKPVRSDDWVFDRECELLLAAST